MKRRQFLRLAASAACLPATAAGQQRERVRRIGVLTSAPEGQVGGTRLSALRKRLEELGWTEGRSITFEVRITRGQPDLIRKYAAELVAMPVDVIFSAGAPNALALQEATSTIPIVFVFVSDPVGIGLVKEVARPAGNITGFSAFEVTLGEKWLELLKECAPTLTQAAIIYNPNTAPNALAFIGSTRKAGEALGVSVSLMPMRDDAELEKAIAEFGQQPGGGLIQVPDPFTAARPDLLATAAMRNGVPLVSPFSWIASAGGLVSYGIDAVEQNREAASYIAGILRGEKPADLPIQHPTKLELVINLKTAKALGVTVPASLLARADEVIE